MVETGTTFGTWLRHRRRQLDLTQVALAARVGYSVVTIRKVERDELRPSRQLSERLAKGLGVAAEEQETLIAFARSMATHPPLIEPLPIQSNTRSNLPPQLTPFFGRTSELLALEQSMADPACRLLTLAGPGGIGKTRLALEIAQAQLPQTLDGVYLVSLAPLRSAEHIIPAIAEALSFQFQTDSRPPKEQLFDYLRHKQILLLLDNFEHLAKGAELIQELLQSSPLLRLLVTSRERLHLSNETVFTLGGLDFPAVTTLQETLTYSAVQLFITTACRTRPKFALNSANSQDIVRICHIVGGMPLGIILAAAWIEVLSPAEIVAELSQGFGFLQAELRDLADRHQSMSAVLAQSWLRLTEAEQVVFMRLSVFRGGFTRQAAQSIAGASLQTLSGLVNKSLVQRDANQRYTIHELLRQYAEKELEEAGRIADASAAHCAYYTDYLQQRELDLKGRRQVEALDEIEQDFENVRAAWQWAIAQRDYVAVGNALESLYWFCEMRSRYHEGLELLRSGREGLAPVADNAPHPVWGQLMARVLGQDFRWFDPPTESRERIDTALTLAQVHNDQSEVAFCLWSLAMAVVLSGDVRGAIPYFERSIVHYQALEDHFYLANLHRSMGLLYHAMDQSPKGYKLIAQSVDTCRDTGNLNGLSQSLAILGWFNYNCGRYSEAEAHWHEGRELCLRIGARYALVPLQMGFTWLALFERGDFGALHTLSEELRTIVAHINDSQNQHRSMLIVFGFLAGMDEEYAICHQMFQQVAALNFPYLPFTTSWELMGICLAACGLDDVANTEQHLRRVLEISLMNEWPANAAKALTFAAVLMAKAGKQQRAVQLLGLVFHHPLSPKGWLRQWPLITRLRTELEAILTPEVFARLWTYGTQLDLMATAEAVIGELAEDSSSSS